MHKLDVHGIPVAYVNDARQADVDPEAATHCRLGCRLISLEHWHDLAHLILKNRAKQVFVFDTTGFSHVIVWVPVSGVPVWAPASVRWSLCLTTASVVYDFLEKYLVNPDRPEIRWKECGF